MSGTVPIGVPMNGLLGGRIVPFAAIATGMQQPDLMVEHDMVDE